MERQHQWGMRMRRCFRTVQDPLVVRALVRKKAASCNMHPDVLAQVESTDVGNKQNLSERKADPISIKRQKQHDEGRFPMRWNILAVPKRRRLPGRRYYSSTGRSIRMTRMPRRRNICVILTRSESDVPFVFHFRILFVGD